uniref:Ribosomal protein S12 n=1 Tax=Gracilaria chouae TaxID=1172980 RepID=A0A291ICC9_9FLOR|nr:ribosomal protein S12 [Gracilaria chouae]
MPTFNQLLKSYRQKKIRKTKSTALEKCPQKKRASAWKFLPWILKNQIQQNVKLLKCNLVQENLLRDIFLGKVMYYKNIQ